jgi:hypothetical protein
LLPLAKRVRRAVGARGTTCAPPPHGRHMRLPGRAFAYGNLLLD